MLLVHTASKVNNNSWSLKVHVYYCRNKNPKADDVHDRPETLTAVTGLTVSCLAVCLNGLTQMQLMSCIGLH